MTFSKRILIVDDDVDAADMLGAVLRLRKPFAFFLVTYTGSEAVRMTSGNDLDVVVLDLELGCDSGFDIAQAIRAQCGCHCPALIAMSGNLVKITAAREGTLFAHAFQKPLAVADLLASIGDSS
jgi:CheY-like chemotaxis protein